MVHSNIKFFTKLSEKSRRVAFGSKLSNSGGMDFFRASIKLDCNFCSSLKIYLRLIFDGLSFLISLKWSTRTSSSLVFPEFIRYLLSFILFFSDLKEVEQTADLFSGSTYSIGSSKNASSFSNSLSICTGLLLSK